MNAKKIVGGILHWLFVAVLAVAVVVVAYFGIALCSILLVFFFHDREFSMRSRSRLRSPRSST